MATNYTRGRRYEYVVRDRLVEAGYFVTRAAKSAGASDLTALRAGSPPLLVQCKRDGYIPPDEWNALIGAADVAGAVPLLACPGKKRGQHLLFRLTARKSGKRGEPQPMEPYTIE